MDMEELNALIEACGADLPADREPSLNADEAYTPEDED